MSDSIERFETTLKSQGYSLTAARRYVFDALDKSEPMTMRQLVTKLDGVINRASIYRVIEIFEKLGIIHRIQTGWKYKIELSDTFNFHHHHITCITCGLIVPLHENLAIESAISSLATEYGFALADHQLEIQGTCAKCTKKDPVT